MHWQVPRIIGLGRPRQMAVRLEGHWSAAAVVRGCWTTVLVQGRKPKKGKQEDFLMLTERVGDMAPLPGTTMPSLEHVR